MEKMGMARDQLSGWAWPAGFGLSWPAGTPGLSLS